MKINKQIASKMIVIKKPLTFLYLFLAPNVQRTVTLTVFSINYKNQEEIKAKALKKL